MSDPVTERKIRGPGGRWVSSRPHEGRAAAEPVPDSQGPPSGLLWVAPDSCLTGDRSQPLLEPPTPCLQEEGIAKCVLPGKSSPLSVLVIFCCVTHTTKLVDQNSTHFLCHCSCGAGVWARLFWVLCSESYKATIVSWLSSVSLRSPRSSSKFLSVVVDRIQSLVAGGLSLYFPAGCQPEAAFALEATHSS